MDVRNLPPEQHDHLVNVGAFLAFNTKFGSPSDGCVKFYVASMGWDFPMEAHICTPGKVRIIAEIIP